MTKEEALLLKEGDEIICDNKSIKYPINPVIGQVYIFERIAYEKQMKENDTLIKVKDADVYLDCCCFSFIHSPQILIRQNRLDIIE